MNHNTNNTWKVFALIVAITVAISFGLTSTVKAQDPNEPVRDADWWVSQTSTTPLGTSYYQAAGPDTGFGITFVNQGYTSPIFGSQNYNTGGVTYAGGLPLYVNPVSPMGSMTYGSLAPMAASLSGMGSAYNTGGYNTAAGQGSVGYTGFGGVGYTGLMGGYTTGSYGYPTMGGYTTSSYGGSLYGGLYGSSQSSYGGLYGSSLYGGLYGSSQPAYGSAYGYTAQPAYGSSYGGYTAQPAYGSSYGGYTAQPAYGGSYGYTAQPAYGYPYGGPATSGASWTNNSYGYTAQPAYGYPYGGAVSTPGYPSSNGGYPYIIY